jgi:hypothetical protein
MLRPQFNGIYPIINNFKLRGNINWSFETWNIDVYCIHKVFIWGILQSDWFCTSRILAHILLVEKNKMAAQTDQFWASIC